MREYVVMPRNCWAPGETQAWVEKSLTYVSSLPAKQKKSSGVGRGLKSLRSDVGSTKESSKNCWQPSLISTIEHMHKIETAQAYHSFRETPFGVAVVWSVYEANQRSGAFCCPSRESRPSRFSRLLSWLYYFIVCRDRWYCQQILAFLNGDDIRLSLNMIVSIFAPASSRRSYVQKRNSTGR